MFLATLMQPQPAQQQQQQQQTCIQAVNGQWFVQAQLQHVQTNSGTVIAVLPNYSRNQNDLASTQGGLTRQSPQQVQHQQLNMGIMTSQQQPQQSQPQQQQQQQQQKQQKHQQRQQHQQKQQQQHGVHIMHAPQQHHQIIQTSKPVALSTVQSSQGLPVVQQLLSAPALPRQQLVQS